jgi:hypothetical protein
MDIEGVLAIIFLFGGGTAIAIAFSPVGKAIADRIRGKSAPAPVDEELRAELAEHRNGLQGDLDNVRQELGELAERMDFAERMLQQTREQALPKGGGRS